MLHAGSDDPPSGYQNVANCHTPPTTLTMPFSKRLLALQGQLLPSVVFVPELPIAYETSGGPGRRVLITLFARSLAFVVGTFELSAKACVDKQI